MATTKTKVKKSKCVDILLFNDIGELAMQKRSFKNDSFPGYWDFSAGGHVDKKEEWNIAAEREMREELGVSGQLIFICKEKFKYPDWNTSFSREIDAAIYKMVYNGSFNINHEEVDEVKFFSLEQIQKMIDTGTKFHPEFLLAWRKGIVRE